MLKCLGAVIEPTARRMTLGEEVIYDDGWKMLDLRALRRDKIGFVFQAPYLITFLDVTDNVALLPMLAGRSNAESRKRALELLEALDVAHRAKAMPSQLSGGERQRFSIARALVNRPPVILAGAGLLRRRRWAVYASLSVAISTILVFAAFAVHIIGGGAFEMRTIGALAIRALFWIAVTMISMRAMKSTPDWGL